MKRFATLAIAGALAATAVAGSPAQAHDHTGAAIAAGLIGLGIGAAIASDHPRPYRPYYAPPPPPPPEEVDYYAPPPPPPDYRYDYVEHCRVFDHWDGYLGQYVRTRRCW